MALRRLTSITVAVAGVLLATSIVVAGATAGAAPATATGATVRSAAAKPAGPKYATAGPYAAGVTTLALPDREVEVWYPVEKKSARGAVPATYDLLDKAPPALVALLPAGTDVTFETDAFRDLVAARKPGGFPLVLLAHGAAAYRESMSYLASHLASWGFVVAAPDLLERGLASFLGSPPADPRPDVEVLRDTAALLRAENARAGGPLARRVRKDTLAVTGESAGGTTALRFANEPGVLAAIPISASGYDAASGSYLEFPGVPVMFVTGTDDQVVPLANVEAGYQNAGTPARFVAIEGAGHATLTDICPIGGEGGLVGVAERARLPVPENVKQLAADGCQSATPYDQAWPVVRHVVTAQLREAFGIDRKPVGLKPRTMAKFAPVVVQYEERS